MAQPAEINTAPLLRPGLVVGRYRIETQIARSPTSRVYFVRHHITGARAVLKVGTADSFDRIRQEAAALAAIESPHVPALLQVVRLPQNYEAAAGFVMEAVEGRTLRDILRTERRLEPVRTFRIALQLLSALRQCHDVGIRHGDIKPENIVVSAEGGPKERAVLVDFGSAYGARQEGAGAPLLRMSTPQYAAPELGSAEFPTIASDIFSLACVLYEMLSSHRPVAATQGQVCPPVAALVPTSEALSEVIASALDAQPNRRPASAEQFTERLLNVDPEQLEQCRGLGGDGSPVQQETLDTLQLEGATSPPPEAMPSRPYTGDAGALLSLRKPVIWVFTGDPGIDQPQVSAAIQGMAERYEIHLLDEAARQRQRIEYLSGASPPWVVLFGDLHVLLAEPLLQETKRQGETSRLLVSTHANWELLDGSINACGLHGQLCLPADRQQIEDIVEQMIDRCRNVRWRYDTLRLALQDAREDLRVLSSRA